MSVLLVSIGVVALAEIGDKTQLLSLLLAARFRKPIPIILAILAATLANHACAAALGVWITHWLGPQPLRWILGASFLAMAAWALIPDEIDARSANRIRFGAFASSFILFFLAEIGDKTQVATVALAARYQTLLAVVIGTTLGMLLANVPAVLIGGAAATRLPLRAIRIAAATLFALLGVAALAGLDLGL